MVSGSPNKEVSAEFVQIEKQLKDFNAEKVTMQRILGQDLQVFLP